MKKFKKLSFIVIQIMFCLLTVSNNIYAAGSAGNSGMFKIYNPINNPFSNTVSAVIGVIQAVGMSTAVITLTVIGIKYILTSPEGKAEVKKQISIHNRMYSFICWIRLGRSYCKCSK